ncbi:MAG TPA: cytochrome c [Candidatus Binatia bacterium]
MKHRGLFQAIFFVMGMLFLAPQLFAQEDAIEKRQKLMKNNGAAAKAIKGGMEQKDYATIETKAKDIGNNMDKVLDLFPKGSTSEKSRALPAIWEKWDEFSKNPAKVKKAANEVAEAAKAKDDAALGAKVKALGDACAGCHKNFRAEEKKG